MQKLQKPKSHWLRVQRCLSEVTVVPTRDAVEFKITYLKKMKELLAANKTPQDFVEAMKKAWPGLT